MSANDAAVPAIAPAPLPWKLWRDQALAVLRFDLARNFLTLRGLWIYGLAFAPVVLVAGHALASYLGYDRCELDEDTGVLAGIFQLYYLRLGIFFGCMGIFTRLFRGEVAERTLHYYFLTSMRREVLVIGKYLAGWLTATILFGSGVFLCFALMYLHLGAAGQQFVFHGPGLSHCLAYLGVTVLACLGYGALFLAMGLRFGNPILPAVVILGWETINNVLPAWMKKLSIIFYLKPLCPVDVPISGLSALFTVAADPVATYLAVPGLILLSALILWYSCRRIRKMEISYSAD